MKTYLKNVFIQILIVATICSFVQHKNNQSNQIIIGDPIYVQARVNQSTQITLPYKTILGITSSNAQLLQKYIRFQPNGLKLQTIRSSELTSHSKKKVLESLRSPLNQKYSQIFEINKYVILYSSFNNNFQIFYQNDTQFKKIKQFIVIELKQTKSNFYLIGEQIVVFSQKNNMVISPSGYYSIRKLFEDIPQAIIKIYNSILIFVNKQLWISSIQNKNWMQKYKFQDWKAIQSLKNVKVITESEETAQLLIISQTEGLYLIDLNLKSKAILKQRVVVSQNGCFDFDFQKINKQIRIVLSCRIQYQSASMMIKIKENGQIIKEELKYEWCYSQKHILVNNYVASLQAQSIDVEWKPSISSLHAERRQINLDGLQCYLFTKKNGQMNLISVRNNRLIRQAIQEENYSLQIISSSIVQTQFPLQIKFVCDELKQKKKTSLREFEDVSLCEYRTIIKLNVHQNILSFKHVRSMSIGLILIIIITNFVLVILCFLKYRGIQNVAFRTLASLKRGSNKNLYQNC